MSDGINHGVHVRGDMRVVEENRRADGRLHFDGTIKGFCPKCNRVVFVKQTIGDRFKDAHGVTWGLLKHWCPQHNLLLHTQKYPLNKYAGNRKR